jgi:pilus assembly protein FimV
VRKSLLKLLGVIAGLMLSTCVSAIGMGGINVASALGQPLKADIELVSVNKAEKASLVARLASPDIYRGAGLEYPFGNKFKFQIESRANGESYIRVSSAQPINDPFVSLLVELTWASGKLLREYTFLLDPPDYVAERPAVPEVQAVAPAAPVATAEPAEQTAQERAYQQEWAESTKQQPQKQAQPIRATAPMDEKALRAVPERKPVTVVSGDVTVQRGDTLHKIAMQNKPAEVSLERMLVALYRANADQFDGKNMNRIRAGKILRLPEQSELMSVAQSDATREIRAQTADWNAYRQKLAAAAPADSQPQEAQQVATGKIASSVADKAPVAKESAKEVLKLSKGEAPGDQAVAGTAGKPATAQDKKDAEQEDAIAREKSLKEEQARAALLEKNLKDMERLAQLKSEAAALAAQPSGVAAEAASAVAAASAVVAASDVAAASEVKPAPVAKPKPKPKLQPAPAPQPSLMDEILGEPLYLIGGAAILLGLGGLGFMLVRRKQAAAGGGKGEEAAGETTSSHLAVPAASSPDTGDFTNPGTVHAEPAHQADDVDPISEADLFLNFGRDAQAEEILKEALQNSPNDHRIHLKLLGIYANRKDTNSFSTIARQLKDSGDEEAWQQAAGMGRKLEPNNPMYGGAGTIEDDGSATMQTTVLSAPPDFDLGEAPAPEVDFDLGGAEKTATLSADDKAAAQAEVMDFDITSTSPSLAAMPEAMDFDVTSTSPSLSAPTEMDFDITSTNPSLTAAGEEKEGALPNLDDLVFDVTSTHPPMPAAQPEAEPEKAAPAEDAGMEFTLDFPIEEPAGKPLSAAQPAETGFAGISLNLDDIGAPGEPAAGTKDEHWHEVATKLDLAKAYQEMGDVTGAREILDEVMREGDEGQREAAQSILDQIG